MGRDSSGTQGFRKDFSEDTGEGSWQNRIRIPSNGMPGSSQSYTRGLSQGFSIGDQTMQSHRVVGESTAIGSYRPLMSVGGHSRVSGTNPEFSHSMTNAVLSHSQTNAEFSHFFADADFLHSPMQTNGWRGGTSEAAVRRRRCSPIICYPNTDESPDIPETGEIVHFSESTPGCTAKQQRTKWVSRGEPFNLAACTWNYEKRVPGGECLSGCASPKATKRLEMRPDEKMNRLVLHHHGVSSVPCNLGCSSSNETASGAKTNHFPTPRDSVPMIPRKSKSIETQTCDDVAVQECTEECGQSPLLTSTSSLTVASPILAPTPTPTPVLPPSQRDMTEQTPSSVGELSTCRIRSSEVRPLAPSRNGTATDVRRSISGGINPEYLLGTQRTFATEDEKTLSNLLDAPRLSSGTVTSSNKLPASAESGHCQVSCCNVAKSIADDESPTSIFSPEARTLAWPIPDLNVEGDTLPWQPSEVTVTNQRLQTVKVLEQSADLMAKAWAPGRVIERPGSGIGMGQSRGFETTETLRLPSGMLLDTSIAETMRCEFAIVKSEAVDLGRSLRRLHCYYQDLVLELAEVVKKHGPCDIEESLIERARMPLTEVDCLQPPRPDLETLANVAMIQLKISAAEWAARRSTHSSELMQLGPSAEGGEGIGHIGPDEAVLPLETSSPKNKKVVSRKKKNGVSEVENEA